MKKISAALMAIMVALAAVGCSEENSSSTVSSDSTSSESKPAASVSALDALKSVWEKYSASFTDDMFVAPMGGDFSEENNTMEGPGKVTDMEGFLQTSLLVPSDKVSNVSEAASVIHMMSANVFTSGGLKVTGDVSAFASALKDRVVGNEWMCGFPDKIVVFSEGDVIIYAFGNEDLINGFKTAVKAAFPSASELYDQALM